MPDFRILGPLEVSDETGPLLLGGQKQRAVLALLLLEPGRVVSTDRLIDALWGENPPRTAPTSLQNFISQLRKTLGPEVLETKSPGYRLRVRPGELDLDRFRVLVETARTAGPAERAEKLRHALALWRGPALADFTFEAFAQPHIVHLEELRVGALEERVEAELETGLDADLIGELEVLVEEFPLRERLRGQYMLALYRSGRQAEALQAYQEGRRILFEQVLGALFSGRLVAVLGADVADLATRLAQRFDYSDKNGYGLPRVAQYVSVMKGSGPLYDELHALLDADAAPTPIHRFFASLPPLLRERNLPHQLLVTTSYDLALEAAFLEAGEEFDVVSYMAAGPERQWESFVVTEDDYIDYLSRSDVAAAVPVGLAAKLRRSHFLFLGYTMADWNLRVILNRLWSDQPLSY